MKEKEPKKIRRGEWRRRRCNYWQEARAIGVCGGWLRWPWGEENTGKKVDVRSRPKASENWGRRGQRELGAQRGRRARREAGCEPRRGDLRRVCKGRRRDRAEAKRREAREAEVHS